MEKYIDSRVRNFSIQIGKVTTLPTGSEAKVVNRGTATDLILDFFLPRGEQGLTGTTGSVGPAGSVGPPSAVPGPAGPKGDSGLNGLTATEIEEVVAKALAESRAELKRSLDQEVATFKAKIDQLHEAIKTIL